MNIKWRWVLALLIGGTLAWAAETVPAAAAQKPAKSREPLVHDAEWARWHPAPPAPLDVTRLRPRPELPRTPVRVPAENPPDRRSAAEVALRKGLDCYYRIATKAEYPGFGKCAGWCGSYSADLKFRSGEDSQQLPPDAVKMQAVGTPQVLEAYLVAYLALGDPAVLARAREAGNLLLAGQSPYGGWFFEMWVGPTHARGAHVWPGRAVWPDPGPEHGTDSGTLDDGNTFGPAEALYKLWWVTKEQRYYEGWRRAMDFLLLAQAAYGGGFPQAFPSDGYHRYATFNDGVMLNCVETLLTAGGYTWQGAWGTIGLELAERYQGATRKPPRPRIAPPGDPALAAALKLRPAPDPATVRQIIENQAENGCWFGGGRSGRQKKDTSRNFFGSAMFVQHVHRLAEAVAAQSP